jgi:hypothetical protein
MEAAKIRASLLFPRSNPILLISQLGLLGLSAGWFSTTAFAGHFCRTESPYGSERWWVTLSYGYQIQGTGLDEPADGKTFAEEVRNESRLKVGLNF